ncbi:MAG: ABC transporter ATP-binding protein [Acidimicrobiales bacterium]
MSAMADPGVAAHYGAVSVISTQNLTKRFPRVTALDQLSLAVGTGVVGLVGANGAGKSTLIKILLGLLAPTSGRAEVLGLDVTTQGPELRQRVGYMPEHDCLPPDVSATEFVVHMARISGLPPAAARERTADTLRHVGLYEERYRPIGGYSTGMQQRVKLAQSLVHDPRLIFLDEPTNGLDPVGRDDMLRLIRRIGTDFGISVLVASHLLGELERICDHVVIIDAGRLLRSSEIAAYTQATEVLTIEVTDGPHDDGTEALGARLAEAGVAVRRDGHLLEVQLRDDTTYDQIRDLTAEIGVGLVRLQQGRHRIEEVFTDQQEPADVGA